MKRLGNNAISCGDLQGHIKGTKSEVRLSSVEVKLDGETAWALCNILSKNNIEKSKGVLEKCQMQKLINLGEALAAFVDHPNRNIRGCNE